MKVSIYRNPHYCLSFNTDVVFLDVEVEIAQINEASKTYRAKVLKSQLHSGEEAFAVFLLGKMTTDQLASVMERLNADLLAEIEQSLFSLYYVGEIQKDATDITS